MGVLSSLLSTVTKLTLVLLLVALLPGLPPYVEFEAYSVTPAAPLEGPLALNCDLNDAEHLFENILRGPEDLRVYDGHLYTGVHGGYVVRLVGNKVEKVVKFGQPCEPFLHEESKCGRPLGIHFDKHGKMYVADGYYGLFKVDVKSGQYETLVSSNETIEGKRPMIPNGVTVGAEGFVYWSDSSTSHHINDGLFTMLANGNGRVIKYDPRTKSNSVLMDKLHFPNGLALSSDGSFLLISETARSRILKYHLKGSKVGQSEVWLDGLPGMPDNIDRVSDGMFVVSFVQPRDELDILARVAPYPLIRKLGARLLLALETAATLLRDIYPNQMLKNFAHLIGHFESFPQKLKRVTVLFVNENGEVTRSLHAQDGLYGISSMVHFEGYYYLGSPYNNFLARVKTS